LITIFYPFVNFNLDKLNVGEYKSEISRLYDYNDPSAIGRTEEIRYAAEQIIEKNHYFVKDDYDVKDIRKPHNWFWALAMTYGLIISIIYTLCFIYLVQKLSPEFSFIICTFLLFCGFLDHVSIWPPLYLLIIVAVLGHTGNTEYDNVDIS